MPNFQYPLALSLSKGTRCGADLAQAYARVLRQAQDERS